MAMYQAPLIVDKKFPPQTAIYATSMSAQLGRSFLVCGGDGMKKIGKASDSRDREWLRKDRVMLVCANAS